MQKIQIKHENRIPETNALRRVLWMKKRWQRELKPDICFPLVVYLSGHRKEVV